MELTPETGSGRESARGARPRPAAVASLWFALLAPPVAALVNQGTAYALVPRACAHPTHGAGEAPAAGGELARAALLVLPALALLVVALAVVAALRRRHSPEGGDVHRGVAPLGRAPFLVMVALGVAGISALVILGQWIAIFLLDPCARA